jgi:hypothetical protein
MGLSPELDLTLRRVVKLAWHMKDAGGKQIFPQLGQEEEYNRTAKSPRRSWNETLLETKIFKNSHLYRNMVNIHTHRVQTRHMLRRE